MWVEFVTAVESRAWNVAGGVVLESETGVLEYAVGAEGMRAYVTVVEVFNNWVSADLAGQFLILIRIFFLF